MLTRSTRITVIVAAALAAALGAYGDNVGEASYLDGSVDVYRGGGKMSGRDVDIGMAIENFDMVKTGNDGQMEITLSAGPAPDTVLKVEPGTSFTVEVGKVRNEPRTTVNMISGSVGLKVRKLTGAGEVQVRTESAIMGVRGTEFSVSTPPSGDILITCSEGAVSCVDETGTELRATPGTAVEKIPGERFRTIPVAVSSLQEFRRQWIADRIEALRANAPRAIANYAERYERSLQAFDEAYRQLMQERDTLNKWATEDQQGQTGGSGAIVMAEKKRIIGPLLRLRSVLFVFERVYYRLDELEEYHRQGHGRTTLRGGVSSEEFFRRFDEQKQQLANRMALIRYAAKLYTLRNDGAFPADLLGEGGDDEDFFGSAEDFFGDD